MATSDYTSEIPYGYCHCGCGQKTTIASQNKTKHNWIKGEPLPFIQGHHRKHKQDWYIPNFWSKVNKNGSVPSHMPHLGRCWEWTAGICMGYGAFFMNGCNSGAHRISWKITNGEIPDGLFVLHKCDNRLCVNPSHLFLGTQQDNIDDMILKERIISPLGEDNGQHKLNDRQVIEIRQAYENGDFNTNKMAYKYGVSGTLIRLIVRRKIWKHV